MDSDIEKKDNPELLQSASLRAVFVLITIIIVVLIGCLYLWGSTLKPADLTPPQSGNAILPNKEPETPRANADIQAVNTLSSSDEPSAIEAE